MAASSQFHASAVLYASTHEQKTWWNQQGNYPTHYGNGIFKILASNIVTFRRAEFYRPYRICQAPMERYFINALY
jgi:hypothetical protein